MLPFEGSKKSSVISRKLTRNNDIEQQGQTSSIDLSSVPSEIDALRSKFKEKGTLTAEDIKQSKDRINALRNIFPFYNPAKHKLASKTDDSSEKADRNPPEPKPGFSKEKLCSDQYEEKDTCDKSDTESIQSIQECKLNSIVHSRIASYEGGELNSNNNARKNQFSPESEINRTSKAKTLDDSWRYSKPKKGKLGALKEKYSNSVTNFTYDGFSFGSQEKDNELAKEEVENLCKKTSKKIDYVHKEIGSEYLTDPSPLCEVGSQDNLIYRLQTEIDNLEARNKSEKLSNVIIGNKDILKLLSNKHLANLNIRVEKNGDVRKDNRWRDNMGSFRAAKSGIRTSLRSSKRKKKQPPKFRSGINYNNFEEKGTSDSTLKENESDSDEEFYKRSYEPTCQVIEGNDKQSKYSTGEYIKKKFPEYAKVNKKRGLISQKEIDAPPRSLSTSPIERAPVVKKICSSSARLKKDCEPTLTANPVKKVDSFRGSRVTRRNSFLYNTRGKTAKEGLDQESFVKTQAVRLRRKDSRNSKQSEYRVSVTIRPSTVANLANKFNTIILQNQPGNAAFGKVSVVESKVPKYYSSPRASFKRKYRHKSSKAAKESKAKESSKLKNENTTDSSGIDNSIYYTGTENVSAATRRSLNNSLSELNMKDLFEDSDYNKTDEEKVCEKLKTALSSGKFKGETDDSEDDLSSKVVIEGDEISDAVGSPVVTQNVEDELLDSNILLMQAFTKSNKSDSEILIPHNNDSPSKIFSSEFAKTNIEKPKLTSAREGHCKSDSIDSGIAADEDKLIRENREEQEVSLEHLKSSDTLKDDDSATLGNIVPSAAPESQLNEECLEVTNTFENSLVLELGEARETNEENLTEAVNTAIVREVDSIQTANEECSLSKESPDAPGDEDSDLKKENNILLVETEMKRVPDEISSECSGSIRGDGNYSEVSSICSELKGKKSKDEMGIYTSLKTVVKNTVKKSKEKDAVKNKEKDKKRSPSRERNKWYKRGKSRERKVETTDDEGGDEKIYGAVTQVKKEKEGKLYEKWAFKRKPKEPKEKSSEGKTSEECSERKPREKTRDGKSKDKTKEKSKEKRNKENSKERKPRERSNEKKKEENSSQTCQEEKSAEKEQEKSAEKGQERSAEKEQEKSAEKEQEICAEKEQVKSTEKEQFKSIESRPNGEDRDYEDSKLSTASKGGEDINNYSETTDSDIYQDFSSSDKEEAKEGLYGKLKFASRSRSREKRLAKKMSRVELRKLSTKTETIQEEKESPKGEEDTSLSLEEAESDSLTKKDEETKNEPLVIYEPHSSQGVKVIPPPPKTPVPSPPSSFLRLFTKNRNKSPIQKELDTLKAEETTVSSDSNDTTENIYENLYSPDMTKLKRNREKLEGRGIKPNSSFLWSGTAVVSTPATVTKAILDQVPKSSRFGKFGSSLISKNSSEDSSSDGHNYTEIQNNSSGDSQIVAYDDIGAASAVSYDEIAAPSSCGYDDIRPPSLPEVEFDHYKTPSEGYDPVNPPKSDSSQYDECSGGIITAQMAVIRQNKIDSLSYVYDDVSMYNSSIASHSYEPVCPPEQPSIPVIMEVPEGGEKSHIVENASVVEEVEQIDYDDSEYGPHEVFSYKLTQISKGCPVTATRTPIPSNPPEEIYGAATPLQSKQMTLFKMESGEESSNHEKVANSFSKAKKKRLEATGKEVNHWEDVTDSEDEEEIPVTLTTRIPFVRKPNLKRVARYRVNKKSWIQGVRDVAAHKRIPHVHAHSTNLAKVHPHHARTHITHTRSHTHIRTNTDHVITYSWRQKPSDSLDGILRWKNGSLKPPARTPSKLSTISSSSKSSSSSNSSHSFKSSSSCSSSFSSLASHSSCTLPGTPIEKEEDCNEDQVYVSSSSTIILIGHVSNDSNLYDEAYGTNSSYYNASTLSSCSFNDYESAKIRSIYYEDDNASELQEISCFVEEGGESDNEELSAEHYEAIYEVISPADEEKAADDVPEEELGFGEDLNGPLDDDSFDSDDSDEAYSRLQPQVSFVPFLYFTLSLTSFVR